MTNNKTNKPILTLSTFQKDKEVVTPPTTTSITAPVATENKTKPDSMKSKEQEAREKQEQANKALKYKEMLQHLQQQYPTAFPEKPVLLSIKIHEQLFEQEISSFSKSAIRNFLRSYTKTPEYRKAKRNSRIRYNLDGSVSTEIHPSEQKAKHKSKNLKHDVFFKNVMANDIAAKEFLTKYLPKEVKDIVDLNSIKPEKESYVEPNLTKRFSDIVYSVNTKDNQTAFIYVLAEHQSSVDSLISFRLWKYTLLLAERHINKKQKIPLIFPIVVYAGKEKYTAPRNLWALFDNPELAKKLLTEDHAIVDLQAMSDDEITKKKHFALFEYVLKHIHMRDMLKLCQNLFDKLPDAVAIDQKHGYFYITNFLWYADTKLSVEKRDELSSIIIEHLPKNKGENIMKTIADSYIQEGISKGITIGKNEGIAIGEARGEARGGEKRSLEIAKRMLKEKTDIKFICSVTGLDTDAVLKLQNSL